MERDALIGLGIFAILAGILLFAPQTFAACQTTDTFTLRISDPTGTDIKTSPQQSINPVDGVSCNTADSDSTSLGIYCQMNGTYRARITCDSCPGGHTAVSSTAVLSCLPAESDKLVIRNGTGNITAAFDSKGYLYLREFNYSFQPSLSAPKNSFAIRNNTGFVVAYIAQNGSLYLSGNITMNQTIISPPKRSFILTNHSRTSVSYIDDTGNLVLSGKVYFNWTGTI